MTSLIFFTVIQNSIDSKLASNYFKEAHLICRKDGGKLWGKSLDGPIILVTRSGDAVLSKSAPGFTEHEGVWLGKLPTHLNIANTAVTWNEEKWTMMIWPLPENQGNRLNLMSHELFHRIQSDIGLPANSPSNGHLETELGRIWLQLELKALSKALRTNTQKAMSDALALRSYRQSKFPKAAEEEDALELNEGLAEYTGLVLRGSPRPQVRKILADRIDELGFNRSSYSRSFAYETGAAYAILLDGLSKKNWRTEISAKGSLAKLLGNRIGNKKSKNSAYEIAQRYEYQEIAKQEKKREQLRLQTESKYLDQFVKRPILILPLSSPNFQFDPGNLYVLGSLGTVYPNCVLKDVWGQLTVTGGVLISSDFRKATVSAPTKESSFSHPDWKLKLDPGWKVVPKGRSGDVTLEKTSPR